jgi:hypothetical protein
MFLTSYGKVYTVQELSYVPALAYDLGCGLIMSMPPITDVLMKAVMPGVTYDYAVPQPWFDKYYDDHGEPPRAIWVYDDRTPLFGRPVFIAELEKKYKRMVLNECNTWTGV